MTDSELRAMTGEDLHALLRELASPVASVSIVSSLKSPQWSRAAFRIACADDSLWKGRRFESPTAAEQSVRLGRCLPVGPFPRIVASQGVAVLGEWIEGAALASGPTSNDQLRRAGVLLRAVHAAEVPWSDFKARTWYPTADWQARLAARIDRLTQAGELTAAEGRKALDVASAHVPEPTRIGLIHGDLSPENIVVDALGELRVIDDDSIGLHAPEFDLARTWYRWPMTVDGRTAFEEGYGVRDVASSYHAHLPHWKIVVLIGAADFRIRHGLPGASVPLRLLRDVLETL
jgi:thiamine kinase-like enzyme